MKKWTGMFYWTDTEGIPLEMVVERVERAGFDVVWELRLYVLQAIRAGWSRSKIISDLREATVFGVPVPPELLLIDRPQREKKN